MSNNERLMKVLLAPRVTEKSTILGDKHNQYVFKVVKDASKPEIKKAVELMFTVEVDSVQVCVVKGKRKRFKNVGGSRSDWKKSLCEVEAWFRYRLYRCLIK